MTQFTASWVAIQNAKRDKPSPETGRKIGAAVASEIKLHEAIMAWCDAQWPQWIYIHARMDAPTTTECGSPDFIIFAPEGRVFCIECKAKDKKQSYAQLCWEARLKMLKWHVYKVVRNMDEFLEVVK